MLGLEANFRAGAQSVWLEVRALLYLVLANIACIETAPFLCLCHTGIPWRNPLEESLGGPAAIVWPSPTGFAPLRLQGRTRLQDCIVYSCVHMEPQPFWVSTSLRGCYEWF